MTGSIPFQQESCRSLVQSGRKLTTLHPNCTTAAAPHAWRTLAANVWRGLDINPMRSIARKMTGAARATRRSGANAWELTPMRFQSRSFWGIDNSI